MSSEFELELTEPRTGWLGRLIVIGALAVAILTAVLAGVVLDNALGGRIRDRAIWGVLLMAIGAAGPVVAVVVLVRRRHIVREIEGRHWGAVAFFPGSFVAAWLVAVLGYGILGGESNTPIVPYTSKLIISFRPGGNVNFTSSGSLGSQETRGAGGGVGVFEYRARSAGSGEIAITFEGVNGAPDANRAEIRGTLVLAMKVRVQVVGLSDAKLTINDQPHEFPVDLEPGSYQIVIQGTPQQE